MERALHQTELFQGLAEGALARVSTIARSRELRAGEYLFFLGDSADRLYVVLEGSVELCFPIALRGEVKDVPVETAGEGKALGWSTLVKPYRFTLSARATEPSKVAAFTRQDLLTLFEEEPQTGCTLFANVSALVGIRLLTFQALWARELQRVLLAESKMDTEE